MQRSRVGSLLAALAILSAAAPAAAQDRQEAKHETKQEPKQHEAPWYERVQIRGYGQVRYNRIGATNPHLRNTQADRSIGEPGGIFLRRARIALTAEPVWFLTIYLQPDFASAIEDTLNTQVLRDWYADVFFDREKQFRLRAGQSRVPFGWELLQSSQQRLTLDRSDPLNSAFINERDIGVHLAYTPHAMREVYRRLANPRDKGTGDYGLATVGLINGQALNTRERNDNKHFVARLAVPIELGSQAIELAGGGYTGLYVPTVGEGFTASRREIRDLRMHGTFVLYPRPFGLQAEYNAGVGPELVGKRIEERPLDGGYVMATLRVPTESFGTFYPYVRVMRYDGGKKFETNAPRHEVRELNAGIEWQISRWLETTAEYMESVRTVNGAREAGRLLRLQLQFTF